jgi:hypothetical protein
MSNLQTLRAVVVAALQRIRQDSGVIWAPQNPKAATSNRLTFGDADPEYFKLADEIIKSWGENPEELVTPDFYEEIVRGIYEYYEHQWKKK